MQIRPPIRGGSSLTWYDYGYPAGGVFEPDVVAQWTFSETSGDLVDEVSNITLTPAQTGAISYIKYNCQTGYSHPSLELTNPGLTVLNRTSNAWYFSSADTSLGLGTASATFEWIARYNLRNNGQGDGTLYYTCDNSYHHGIYLGYTTILSTPKFFVYAKASDGTTLYNEFTLTTNPFNGEEYKHRLVLNRAGDITYYIDGSVQGTPYSMTSLSGKTLEASQLIFLAETATAYNNLSGTFYEFRQSANATNNSGGPGGG